MTMDVDSAQSSMPHEELVEILQQLRFIKQLSIPFLDEWAARTSDTELASGLSARIAPEHATLDALTERLVDLGEPPSDTYRDHDVEALFQELQSADLDVLRLVGFYRTLKQYLIARYNMLLALADPDTRDIMEDLNEEDERLQRWGESLRVARMTEDVTISVATMEARVQTLTARSRERMAREIRERAEVVSGGVIGKRLGDLEQLMEQFLTGRSGENPPPSESTGA